MQKLKSVFRSSSRKRGQHADGSEPGSPQSSHTDRRGASLDERRHRQSLEASHAGAHQNGRSRPLSSAYDSHPNNALGTQFGAVNHAQSRPSHQTNESIANDYKAYLPALSPVHDSQDEQFMTLGGDRRMISGEGGLPHEENVADRNIDRNRTSLDNRRSLDNRKSLDVSSRKPLPATPGMYMDESTALHDAETAIVMKNHVNGFAVLDAPDRDIHQKHSHHSHGSTIRSVPSESRNAGLPIRTRDEQRSSDSKSNGTLHETRIAAGGQDDIHREIEQLLEGVVDLRNTVDHDKDVQFAPAVTHEVIKPHEHEIIQHKIFREIHNYEYYHRIQPVYDLQILPPRHWIPNPNGEGLIEISADELPSRTGHNRKWKIVHEHTDAPVESLPTYRTEPEIIEHPTTITVEGFERKETTILHPPTLRDLSEYDGLVQPVHFDHKTGERWLGEITTMHKLRHELGQVADPNMSLRDLGESLPDVSGQSQVAALSHSPSVRRKSVAGPVPSQFGKLNSHEGVAVAV